MTQTPEGYHKSLELELNEIFKEVMGIISSSKVIPQIQEFINVGEYGLALETICGVITEDNYIIPESSYQKIFKLAQRMEIDKKFFEGIKTF